jgi:hypothetical protein
VLIIESEAVEFLEEVEGDVRLDFLESAADDSQIAVEAHGKDGVAHVPERDDDVILHLPGLDLLVLQSLDRLRRHEVLVAEDDDAKLAPGLKLHTAIGK